ncbi:MAG: HAD family hydrolase, partial [Verrucomicrobiota bacterium]|nr:HAD family hydrolase [Verrucomicrobiota bacterium]
MAIEAIVFDVSGTLLTDDGTAQPGVEQMLDELRGLGLIVIAASNDPVEWKLHQAGLLGSIDHVVERSDVGIAKRSPRWVTKFVELTNLQPHQMFYIGDSDNDMITASWGPMIYAHAVWSSDPGPYGLHALTPQWVVNVITYIFRKRHPWYWTLDATDGLGRPVRAMTLIDADGAGSPRARQRLLWLLKDNIDSKINPTPMTLREFVMLQMLSSVYHENLFGGADYWTTYPGHDGAPNSVMGDFLDIAAKLSRNKYKNDLLFRHTPAMKSKQARDLRGPVGALRNQLETVNVGAQYRKKLANKRVILLDNFLTMGYSTESGRTLLLNAGASEVVVACVGKYGQRIS